LAAIRSADCDQRHFACVVGIERTAVPMIGAKEFGIRECILGAENH
jgi:hypothetical protein